VRYSPADDPSASRADLTTLRAVPDSSWAHSRFSAVPPARGVQWVRAHVTLEAPRTPLGVHVAALASHELYWDGVLIGRGGTVGASPAAETPGPVESIHHVPDSLATPGTHSLALRTSSFHLGFSPPNPYWRLGVGPTDELVIGRQRGVVRADQPERHLFGVLLRSRFVMVPRDRAALPLAPRGVPQGLLGAEAWRPLVGATRLTATHRPAMDHPALTWAVGVLPAAFVTLFHARGEPPAAGLPRRHGCPVRERRRGTEASVETPWRSRSRRRGRRSLAGARAMPRPRHGRRARVPVLTSRDSRPRTITPSTFAVLPAARPSARVARRHHRERSRAHDRRA
jgi:hypothetical protein